MIEILTWITYWILVALSIIFFALVFGICKIVYGNDVNLYNRLAETAADIYYKLYGVPIEYAEIPAFIDKIKLTLGVICIALCLAIICLMYL